MIPIQAARITERVLLRVLVGGFSLVVVLLGIAGLASVRSTRAIEDDTAQFGREQLATVRLLNEVHAGQHSLAVVLHQLAPAPGENYDREASLRDLEAADKALNRVVEAASGTPEAALWRELDEAVRNFSGGVRRAIHKGGSVPARELNPLFDLHDKVVLIERRLLDTSEKRMADMEGRIEGESRDLASNARILLGACLGLALLCAGLTVNFARRSIRRIEWQASELSRVSWHMLQTQESAARRFSHELHDELGQSLAAVKANLTAADQQGWLNRRADCIQLVDESIANVRELAQLLHPVILDDFGLSAGLRWLVERFTERTGIRSQYTSSLESRLAEDTEIHLFRIAQEALTNVARHSGASNVSMVLDADRDFVELTIEDNGRGILPRDPESPKNPSLGMTGMRARAREIGGDLRVEPARKDGTGLRIRIRAPKSQEAGEAGSSALSSEGRYENANPVG